MSVRATDLDAVDVPTTKLCVLAVAATHAITLDWFDTTVSVRFDDPVAAAMFGRRYRRFSTNGAASLTAYAVRDADGSCLFWSEPGGAYRWDRSILASRSVAFLADAVVRHTFFSMVATFPSFHAAAIAVDGRAVAIVAPSNSGKTTTAVACARRGMPLYSDERCVIVDGFVQPFPRAMNVRAGSLALLAAEDVADDRGIGARVRAHLPNDWECVDFQEILGEQALPKPKPLSAAFFLDGRGESTAVERLAPADALPRLLAAPFRSRAVGIERVAQALSLLQSAASYALTMGWPDETARLIRATASAELGIRVAS